MERSDIKIEMKKIILGVVGLALMMWGCSSPDDNMTLERIANGTDSRPAWQAPDYNSYEQIMSVDVLLQDTLQSYASSADLMCAVIGNEVCGVASSSNVDGRWLFPLIVASNQPGADITLSYYCDRLHRIFTIAWTTFNTTTPPLGTGGIYQPAFVR